MPRHYGTREYRFEAAHSEYSESLTAEENDAEYGLNRLPHGHNFVLQTQVCGTRHPKSDMIVDLGKLDRTVERLALKKWDHFYFDSTEDRIPTLEQMTFCIWKDLREEIDLLSHITLFESDQVWTDYSGDGCMLDLTRSYTFNAAHRTVNLGLTDEENKKMYGKCFNLHGHTYTLDITIRGDVNPKTSQIVSPHKMDESVAKVLDQFDYQVLNNVKNIENNNPTTENLIQTLWKLLKERLMRDQIIVSRADRHVYLYKLKLRETGRNFFEYYGE